MKYRIRWKSRETGNGGQGEPVFNSKEIAQKAADDLNKDVPNLYHWVEVANEEREDD